MSFWSQRSTTTALLSVIAVLLLILVIQFATKEPSSKKSNLPPGHPNTMAGVPNPHVPGGMPTSPMGKMPSGGNSSQVMSADGNFHPATMVYVAMTCPDDPTMTLDNPACDGKAADTRRELVKKSIDNEESIRTIFDQVVEKYGENALTQQAIQIRRMRTQAPKQ